MHAVRIRTSVGQCMESSGEVWLTMHVRCAASSPLAVRKRSLPSRSRWRVAVAADLPAEMHRRCTLRDVDGSLCAVYAPGVA